MSYLAVHRGPYGVPGIKPRLAIVKVCPAHFFFFNLFSPSFQIEKKYLAENLFQNIRSLQ